MPEGGMFYQIQRPDGTDAAKTLSEGEKSFIAFLYFYHLLEGSTSESGVTSDCVVVFDDPVSSLDSDVLFIVSTLIKDLFEKVSARHGIIKQIFVLTHNVYFHKEVSYIVSKRKKFQKTFWIVSKENRESKLQRYEENPIKSSYDLLWLGLKNSEPDSLVIQNILRRILENYFKLIGGIDISKINEEFKGHEKLIYKSLISWVHDGSHSAYDSVYITVDESTVKIFLKVFKEIFEKTGNQDHYKMMMEESSIE